MRRALVLIAASSVLVTPRPKPAQALPTVTQLSATTPVELTAGGADPAVGAVLGDTAAARPITGVFRMAAGSSQSIPDEERSDALPA